MAQIETLRVGQVVTVDFDGSEFVGHEQQIPSTRPCVIIKIFANLGVVWIAPITSKQQKSIPSIVTFPSTAGLLQPAFVLLHQLRVISSERIRGSKGSFNKFEMARITESLQNIMFD